jgi:hypothetical protein
MVDIKWYLFLEISRSTGNEGTSLWFWEFFDIAAPAYTCACACLENTKKR